MHRLSCQAALMRDWSKDLTGEECRHEICAETQCGLGAAARGNSERTAFGNEYSKAQGHKDAYRAFFFFFWEGEEWDELNPVCDTGLGQSLLREHDRQWRSDWKRPPSLHLRQVKSPNWNYDYKHMTCGDTGRRVCTYRMRCLLADSSLQQQ